MTSPVNTLLTNAWYNHGLIINHLITVIVKNSFFFFNFAGSMRRAKKPKPSAKPSSSRLPLDDGAVLQEKMSLEMFKLWSGTALKSYLCARKKSTEGTFEELAAR